jgi:hypothetical protein
MRLRRNGSTVVAAELGIRVRSRPAVLANSIKVVSVCDQDNSISRPSLKLSLLAHFDPPGVFTRIDPGVEVLLARLPEVKERVNGCVSFCYTMGADIRDRGAPTADELADRRKHLRAALAEFSSMEDAALVDFANVSPNEPPRMVSLTDPRIHIVRLLRHANVHLSATPLSHSHREAIWDGPDGSQSFNYLLILANGLEESVRATRHSRHYDANALTEMLRWLEEEQQEWGINHVILRTAELYARFLLAAV